MTVVPLNAPAPEVELDARERKRLRESARRAFKKDEQARMARAAGLADEPSPAVERSSAAPSSSSGSAATERSDDDRAGDCAAFLSGVLFPVLALLARWFSPWALDLARFTDEQARDDGRAWAGVLRRYPWLDRFVLYSAPAARTIARVRELAKRKDAP